MKKLNNSDFFYYMDLWENYNNKQCHLCGGWAIDCDCENEFTKEDKKGIRLLLREIGEGH